jgi:hypothetical protein
MDDKADREFSNFLCTQARQRGRESFSRKHKQLNLTDEQTAKHESVIREATEKLANTPQFSKEYMAINRARDQSLLEILSAEQKELLVKLKGEKIDLSKIVRPEFKPSTSGNGEQQRSNSQAKGKQPTE